MTLRSILAPIARLMLRNGITYREFCQVSKEVFVEAASKEYGIRGRDTNISRVAVLTGIDRKEVKRVKDSLQDASLVQQVQQKQDRITRVLSAWHLDSRFTGDSGTPLVLDFDHPEKSFKLLTQQYAGDVPARAFLKEMIRVGVAEVNHEDQVTVLKREFIPDQKDIESYIRAGGVLSDIGSTLYNNLYLSNENGIPLRFERRASNLNIDKKYLPQFRKFMARQGQVFLETVDDWLSQHEATETTEPRHIYRVGVGAYAFDEAMPEKPETTDDDTQDSTDSAKTDSD